MSEKQDKPTTELEEVQSQELPSEIASKFTSYTTDTLSEYYNEKEMKEIAASLTKEAANKLHQSIMNMSSGAYSSIPRVCAGRHCPSAHACPLVKGGNEAKFVGKQCFIEVVLVKEWQDEYHETLSKMGEDPNNIVIRNYVNELISCDITDMRLNHYLGQTIDKGGGEITERVFVINPKTGEPETQSAENVALQIKMYVSNRRDRALKALVANPFWKKKMTMKDELEDLQQNINVFAKAKEWRDKAMAGEQSTKVQDAEYQVVNEDVPGS